MVFLANIHAASAYFCVYTPDRNDNKTSVGDNFDQSRLTVAHSSLPFGTKLQVSYNGSIINDVIVNDRINSKGDVFACTKALAEKLDFYDKGVAQLNYNVIELGNGDLHWMENSGNNWYYIEGIKSDNLFSLYEYLTSLGYKVRFENDCLVMMYIVEHKLETAKKVLISALGSDGTFKIVKQEQPPLRT